MQNAKDTFYEVLRGRLTAINPERTTVMRGLTRPGLLVAESELVSAVMPADCFVMGWDEATWDSRGAMPLVTVRCEIRYATAGSSEFGGMDRGRALAAMDAEVLSALGEEPWRAVKMSYSGSNGAVAMSTQIWWGEAAIGEAKAVGERMQRTVTVSVMSYEEAGER